MAKTTEVVINLYTVVILNMQVRINNADFKQ